MIKLVICHNGGGAVAPLDFPYLEKLISETKSDKLKEERTHAYLTLKLSYEQLFGAPVPNIVKSELGRPSFEGASPDFDFSVSHTDGFSVIAFICGTGRVGVDIEEEREREKSTEIRRRFLNNVNISLPKTLEDTEIYFFRLSSGALEKLDTPRDFLLCDRNERGEDTVSEFFSLWCSAEAVMKADGRGFSSLSDMKKILPYSHLSLYSFKDDKKKYRIALSYIPN